MASNRDREIKRISKAFAKHTEKYDKFGRYSNDKGLFNCFQCPAKQECIGWKLKYLSKRLASIYAENCEYLKYLIKKRRKEEQQ